jgi:hypothetical protein
MSFLRMQESQSSSTNTNNGEIPAFAGMTIKSLSFLHYPQSPLKRGNRTSFIQNIGIINKKP